jgi:hypothetical protein
MKNYLDTFNDYDADPDDADALEAYVDEVVAAVEAFGIEVPE